MNPKLPYYMSYPMPLAYDDGRIERRDYEYMRSMYPDTAKRILPYVEEECDRCEYPCSVIYDEYPDRLALRMMCNRIYENVLKSEREFRNMDMQDIPDSGPEAAMQGQVRRPDRPNRPPRDRGNRNWLRDLIEIMLFEELRKRRREDRRRQRRIY